MNAKTATELTSQIRQLMDLMIAYVTDGRLSNQPSKYRELYAKVHIALEHAKYQHPNPHRSLESFYSFCKQEELRTYASRTAYVEDLYSDILLDLVRVQSHKVASRNWTKANDILSDELSPVREQWLKAKNFIVASAPDYENSIKESISSVESCLMVLLNEPNGTLGKIIEQADLDGDIKKIISKAYGFTSNMPFVRHGGVTASSLGKHEAEFFLEFSAIAIVYMVSTLKNRAAGT